jgi:oxygen-independent coproporphyrinogen-3 oxidase
MTAETRPGSYFVANYPPFERWQESAVKEVRAALDCPSGDSLLGLYLHVPFCRKRCRFCYFRVATDVAAPDVDRYVRALIAEAAQVATARAVTGRSPRFVYFGGGTPSFLSVRQLERLVADVQAHLPWGDAEEVTFECEPGTLSEAKVAALASLGMTRISLGVENFDDAILEANGRAHLSGEIERAWGWIQAAGFVDTNVDLIAGLVGETEASWRRTVDRTLAMEADSVTIYQLELPFNTQFVKDVNRGIDVPVADWNTKRSWVGWAFDRFLARGYHLSSGYTLVRDPARVRFLYRDLLWEGCDLVALGVASFGHLSGLHYQNLPGLDDYLATVESGRLPLARGLAPTRRELLIREIVLGLKRGWLDTVRLSNKYGIDPLKEWGSLWRNLVDEGLVEALNPHVTLSRRGLLEVDAVVRRFFEPADGPPAGGLLPDFPGER